METESPIEFDPSLIKKRSVCFDVEGKPFGKQRPRFVRKGKYVSTYTPKETSDYEKHVRKSYIYTCGRDMLNTPVSAELEAIYPIPKSASKKKKEDMLNNVILPTVKPDTDNIAKAVLDSLNKVAYDDDAGIIELKVSKRYGLEPKIHVRLKEM